MLSLLSGGSFSRLCLSHKGLVSTLRARSWLNLLESLKLELLSLLRLSDLTTNSVVCVDLRIGHPNVDEI